MRVHFIENNDRQRKLFETDNSIVYESGYWYRFGDQNAQKLIGGSIFFHDKQSTASKGGGIVLGFRKPALGERLQSLIIIYEVPKSMTDSQRFIGVIEPSPWYGGGGNWKIVGE